MNEKAVILVIDDDKSVLRTFARVLEKNGYEVETADIGKEAIEKINKRFYDGVLVDFRLPDMDGTELLFRTKERLRESIKIMITGLPSLDTGTKALDEGADAYMVKPVKPNELLSLLGEKLRIKNGYSYS